MNIGCNFGIGIDPGPTSSGVVIVNFDSMELVAAEYMENNALIGSLIGKAGPFEGLRGTGFGAVERVVSYGKPAGNNTFMTGEWSGRIFQVLMMIDLVSPVMISRPDVKISLCGTKTFVSDSGTRKTITDAMLKIKVMDNFPATGGGGKPAIGTKGQPGPLFGFPTKKDGGDHCWAAMAVLFGAME